MTGGFFFHAVLWCFSSVWALEWALKNSTLMCIIATYGYHRVNRTSRLGCWYLELPLQVRFLPFKKVFAVSDAAHR